MMERGNGGAMERGRAGVTLVELLVALVILGMMTGIGALSVMSLRPAALGVALDSMTSARRRAIRDGRPVVLRDGSQVLRFLPDGRVLGGLVDPLTGVPLDAN